MEPLTLLDSSVESYALSQAARAKKAQTAKAPQLKDFDARRANRIALSESLIRYSLRLVEFGAYFTSPSGHLNHLSGRIRPRSERLHPSLALTRTRCRSWRSASTVDPRIWDPRPQSRATETAPGIRTRRIPIRPPANQRQPTWRI